MIRKTVLGLTLTLALLGTASAATLPHVAIVTSAGSIVANTTFHDARAPFVM